MPLTKCNVPTDVIGSLGTTVADRGLTTQQFKDKFDEMPEGIKTYLNDTLTAELDAELAKTASEAEAGKVELATDAETTAGTDNTKAVHPAGVKAALDNAGAGFAGMSRQALINGNFDIWQRGTTFTVDGYTADRFLSVAINSGVLPVLTHSRQTVAPGDIPGASYHYRVTTDGAGSGFGVGDMYYVGQRIEHGVRYLCGAGKKVTVSFWARSSIANKKIGMRFIQSYGNGGTPSLTEVINGGCFTLTGVWQKYVFAVATNTLTGKVFGTDNNDTFQVLFGLVWGSSRAPEFGDTVAETFVGAGTIDIAQVQVCSGDVALPFQPKTFGEELRACQRYYEKSFAYAQAPAQNIGSGTGEAGCSLGIIGANAQITFIPFAVRKRATPTITAYNPTALSADWRWYDSSGAYEDFAPTLIVSDRGFRGYRANNTRTYAIGHWTADAEL